MLLNFNYFLCFLGIIYLDFKFFNFFFRYGNLKLIDFGIFKVI